MLLFDNCSFYYNEDTESDRPFVIGVRDRENSDDNVERWDMVSLSKDDAKRYTNYLKIICRLSQQWLFLFILD